MTGRSFFSKSAGSVPGVGRLSALLLALVSSPALSALASPLDSQHQPRLSTFDSDRTTEILSSRARVGPVLPTVSGLTHSGQWLSDANGNVVTYHGINVANKIAPYTPQAQGFTSEHAGLLAETGFGVVRTWIMWDALELTPGVFNDTYLSEISDFITLLQQNGISTMINFGQIIYGPACGGLGSPLWATKTDGKKSINGDVFTHIATDPALHAAFDNFWNNTQYPDNMGLQDHFFRAWKHTVNYFKNVKPTAGIMGYDPLNEPESGSQWATCVLPTGCPLFEGTTLTKFNVDFVKAVREIDSNTMIFYEPEITTSLGLPSYVAASTPLYHDPQLALSFHFYPYLFNDTGLNITARAMLASRATQTALSGDGWLYTEFGANDDLVQLRTNLDSADDFNIGWLYWAWYSTEANGNPDAPGEYQTPQEGIVWDSTKPPTGSNLKTEKLSILARPYAYILAGTPTSTQYNTYTSTLVYKYSTTRPGRGAKSGKGQISQFVVPLRNYPNGYLVNIQGGSISSSAQNGFLLNIVAGASSSSVTVTISPK